MAHFGNNKQYNILIMTAEFYYFYTNTKLFKCYFYLSAGGLETAMGYINEVK